MTRVESVVNDHNLDVSDTFWHISVQEEVGRHGRWQFTVVPHVLGLPPQIFFYLASFNPLDKTNVTKAVVLAYLDNFLITADSKVEYVRQSAKSYMVSRKQIQENLADQLHSS